MNITDLKNDDILLETQLLKNFKESLKNSAKNWDDDDLLIRKNRPIDFKPPILNIF
jgi:hypothetical protein